MIWNCDKLSINQHWYYNSKEQYELADGSDMCLDVNDGMNRINRGENLNGLPLEIYSCSSGILENQQFIYESKRMKWKYDQSYCVDLPNGETTNEIQLMLFKCNDYNAAQNFYFGKYRIVSQIWC